MACFGETYLTPAVPYLKPQTRGNIMHDDEEEVDILTVTIYNLPEGKNTKGACYEIIKALERKIKSKDLKIALEQARSMITTTTMIKVEVCRSSVTDDKELVRSVEEVVMSQLKESYVVSYVCRLNECTRTLTYEALIKNIFKAFTRKLRKK